MTDQELALFPGRSNPRGQGARQVGMESPMAFRLFVQRKKINHLPVFFAVEWSVVRGSREWLPLPVKKVILAHYGIVRQQDPCTEGSKCAVDHVKIKLVLVRAAGPWAVGASQPPALIVHKAHRFFRGCCELKALD